MVTSGLLWYGVFTLTGLWFWALVAAWVIVSFVEIHKERAGWATLWLVAFLAALHLGGVVDVVHTVWTHPWQILGAAAGYVVVGLIWTVFKFQMRLRKIRIDINENIVPRLRTNFLDDHKVGGKAIPPDLLEDWRVAQVKDISLQRSLHSMELRENKSRLMLWAVWWPISMIVTAISDWVSEMFNWLIFDVFGGFFSRMVESEKAKIALD